MSVNLTDSQKKAFSAYRTGANLFITGRPGTGKSVLLKAIRGDAVKSGKTVIMTATTGIASLNLSGGRTIHSVLKWYPGIKNPDYDICTSELSTADILIIDEASMLTPNILSHLTACLHHIKRNAQVIISGDFFQIPPYHQGIYNRVYPFETSDWSRLDLIPIVLSEVIRQKDPAFVKMLGKAMTGDATCLRYFNQCYGKPSIGSAITLTTTNRDADEYNLLALETLPGSVIEYEALGSVYEADFGKSRVERRLLLKPGMPVMALVNDPSVGLYNGAIGNVKDLTEDSIIVSFGGNEVEVHRRPFILPSKKPKVVEASIMQFPLRLGAAITIHKSQGQTYDRVNLQASGCWEPGQLYVALSRVRSIEGLSLGRLLKESDLIASQKVVEYYRSIMYCF